MRDIAKTFWSALFACGLLFAGLPAQGTAQVNAPLREEGIPSDPEEPGPG